MARTIKFFTKETLIRANRKAMRRKANRTLYETKLATLPDDVRFPVVWTMLHNDYEWRLKIAVGHDAAKPEDWGPIWLDVDMDTYADLPEFVVEAA